MEFKEQFREKYRTALRAARANDKDATIAGLQDLYALFVAQYAKDNGDNIITKAKLSYWKDVFGSYEQLIRQYGLGDRRVQKFFGLSNDVDVPSFGDLLGGKATVTGVPQPATSVADGNKPSDDVNIDGIVSPVTETGTPEKPHIEPIEPIKPVAPVEQPIIEQQQPAPVMSMGPEKHVADVTAPTTLESFIGQQHIVKVLLKEIAIAKNEGRKHLDNILLFGNPGLGKSTLMNLIADALGVKCELLDCSNCGSGKKALTALQSFLMRIARENEPVVIAMDEVHMLSRDIQSSLLTLLNSRVYVSLDGDGNAVRIPIDEFTFIAATTDDNKVLPTIKDRCRRLTFQMKEYTPDELRRIYRYKVARMGLTITEEAIDACIPRSRGSLRYVNDFVKGLDNEALHDDRGIRTSTDINLAAVLRYFEEKGIDAKGLTPTDLEILHTLEEANGPMGEKVLAARVGLDIKKYESEYENYLLKIKFINIDGSGRSLTEEGKKYLSTKE